MTRRTAMSSSNYRAGVQALLIVIALAVTAACDRVAAPSTPASPTSALPEPLFANYPSQANEFRFHWSAAPGVDLAAGPAVALRAYLESYRLVDFTGEMSAAYPGFLRATPKNGPRDAPGYPIELGSIRPETPTKPPSTVGPAPFPDLHGYSPYFVARLEPVGEGYRAFVCEGRLLDFSGRTEGTHRSIGQSSPATVQQVHRGVTSMASRSDGSS